MTSDAIGLSLIERAEAAERDRDRALDQLRALVWELDTGSPNLAALVVTPATRELLAIQEQARTPQEEGT